MQATGSRHERHTSGKFGMWVPEMATSNGRSLRSSLQKI